MGGYKSCEALDIRQKYDYILSQEYWKRYKEFGSTPMGSFWISKERQDRRFKIILDEISKIEKTGSIELSDIGCGYGALALYLKFYRPNLVKQYTGYDLNRNLVGICSKNITEDWLQFKVGSQPAKTTMFSVMSGTYNLAATSNIDSWEDYLRGCLSDCWDKTSNAMIFNLQVSKRVRISKENIYYADKSRVLDWCVSFLGPTRIVEYKDLPNDATFVVLRT